MSAGVDENLLMQRNSQLSAMFDGELPAAECELLGRRLAKDEGLRAEWSRYALIGAAIRAETGVKLDFRVAERVAQRLAAEESLGGAVTGDTNVTTPIEPAKQAAARRIPWFKPLAGVGIAASVAAASILWIRGEAPVSEPLASAAPATSIAESSELAAVAASVPAATQVAANAPSAVREAEFSNGEPRSYVVPPTNAAGGASIAPAALANYVVAHSEFSGLLSRRMVLSGLVANDANAAELPPSELPATETVNAGR